MARIEIPLPFLSVTDCGPEGLNLRCERDVLAATRDGQVLRVRPKCAAQVFERSAVAQVEDDEIRTVCQTPDECAPKCKQHNLNRSSAFTSQSFHIGDARGIESDRHGFGLKRFLVSRSFLP